MLVATLFVNLEVCGNMVNKSVEGDGEVGRKDKEAEVPGYNLVQQDHPNMSSVFNKRISSDILCWPYILFFRL